MTESTSQSLRTAMLVLGALFLAATGWWRWCLLLAAISALFQRHELPWRVLAGLLSGFGATTICAAIGYVYVRSAFNWKWSPFQKNSGYVVRTEARAVAAVTLGILSIVLIYPFGLLLGPLSFWAATSAGGRILAARGRLTGGGVAGAGMIIGSVISGLYLFWILIQVASFLTFGDFVPAP